MQNHIEPDLLPSLTAEDLKDLGISSVGHRRRLLEAIAALHAPPLVAAVETTATEPATGPEAERRQVTVMFCDLVGSTALSARLDPEDLREVIGRYQACIAAVVDRHHGFVAKYMGDGALVYFGYPQAHEDDAEQAVRSALSLVDAVGELDAPERLRLRVGIASGLVVVGDLIGAGSAQEQAIVGQTPNLAARLQALAEPNGIVIAESTRRQIGGLFETAELGPTQPKGFAEPQRAWRVLVENRTLGRFEALRRGATPLVGRDEELELLFRRWTQAKAGGGRVVLIAGEPGVGKSRLAEAQIERIAAEPHARLRYFCAPHRQDSALYPVIAQMERAAGFARGDMPAVRLGKLRAVLAEDTPDEDLALIAELHGLAADRAPAPDLSPQRKKELTFNALVRQLERLLRRHPLLMVFEDIQWMLVNQWTFHFVRSEHGLAVSLAEQMEKIGHERNDLAAQLIGRDFRGLACCFLGQFVAARELLERCHGLADPAVRAAASAGLPSTDLYPVMLAHLAETLAYLGYIDQAQSRLNEALAEARRLAHAHTLAHVLAWATLISWPTRSPELQGQTESFRRCRPSTVFRCGRRGQQEPADGSWSPSGKCRRAWRGSSRG